MEVITYTTQTNLNKPKQTQTKTVPNYQEGKLYKLVSYESDNWYIGPTPNNYLCNRFGDHKKTYRKWIDGKTSYRTSFELKYDDCKIVLLEEYQCNSKHELEARERHYIANTPNCVNEQHPGRTRKEYYIDMKEQLLVKVKTYYENKKEARDEYKKQPYTENKEHFQNYKQEWYLNNKYTHNS